MTENELKVVAEESTSTKVPKTIPKKKSKKKEKRKICGTFFGKLFLQ
jgi:hypothetical protein